MKNSSSFAFEIETATQESSSSKWSKRRINIVNYSIAPTVYNCISLALSFSPGGAHRFQGTDIVNEHFQSHKHWTHYIAHRRMVLMWIEAKWIFDRIFYGLLVCLYLRFTLFFFLFNSFCFLHQKLYVILG